MPTEIDTGTLFTLIGFVRSLDADGDLADRLIRLFSTAEIASRALSEIDGGAIGGADDQPLERLLTVQEVADLAGVCVETVRRSIRDGQLEVVPIRGVSRVSKSAAEAWMSAPSSRRTRGTRGGETARRSARKSSKRETGRFVPRRREVEAK